jgi:hypothetical protein
MKEGFIDTALVVLGSRYHASGGNGEGIGKSFA